MLEFLRSLAERYKLDHRAKDFIPDLFQLDVPLLFAAENQPGIEGGNLVGEKFFSFLLEYIQRNNLCPAIMSKIEDILSYVADNEQHNIHRIVLNVLQSVSVVMCVYVLGNNRLLRIRIFGISHTTYPNPYVQSHITLLSEGSLIYLRLV